MHVPPLLWPFELMPAMMRSRPYFGGSHFGIFLFPSSAASSAVLLAGGQNINKSLRGIDKATGNGNVPYRNLLIYRGAGNVWVTTCERVRMVISYR